MSESLPRAIYLLMLLGANRGEAVVGRIRLQKLAFLIEKEIIERRRPKLINENYSFRPYNYGPFSEDVIDDIEFLKDLGLITIKYINDAEIYEITDKGEKVLESLLHHVADQELKEIYFEIAKLKKTWNSLSEEKLLRYVYERYPEYAERSVIKYLLMS